MAPARRLRPELRRPLPAHATEELEAEGHQLLGFSAYPRATSGSCPRRPYGFSESKLTPESIALSFWLWGTSTTTVPVHEAPLGSVAVNATR